MTRSINTDFLTINGAEQIKDLFKQLPTKVANKLERKAMKESIEDLQEEVLSRVPVDSGALKSSIKIKVRRKKGQIVGSVEAGDNNTRSPSGFPYASAVEYGFVHTGHKPGKQPTSAGHIPGKKFMRGAIGSKAQQIIDTFTEALKESAEEEIGKLKDD